MSKKNQSAQNGIACKVGYDFWKLFIACHRRHGGSPHDWPPYLDKLFRSGLHELTTCANGGVLLDENTDVYDAPNAKKTLKVSPSAAERSQIVQWCQNTGYSEAELIALLLRIGYAVEC